MLLATNLNYTTTKAVNGVAFATFVASGQTCIMGARVLVHASIYDKFMDALVKKVYFLHFLEFFIYYLLNAMAPYFYRLQLFELAIHSTLTPRCL